MSETLTDKKGSKTKINPKFNPFPGLRPFGIEESHLFFGREGQSDEILNNLADNRFVAVMGASGSGKSSLIYCGLVPILHGGFITEAGSNWRVIASRPGSGPIDNLATAIVKSVVDEKASIEEKSIQKNITSTILRSSSLGLIETVKQLNKGDGENVLFIIDQFEELFRYRNSTDEDANTVNESAAFVKLLLTAVKQSEVPIYVVLTMRSDFIGDCAQFQELTKAINDSNYLIPQMTREDFKTAIEGPVAVGGGKISSRLVQQLLNDVGDKQDQLPILQHALMRTWDYWIDHRSASEPLDINHYQAIGQMESALSEHANEAYDELSEEEKRVCESMFKTLTEKGGDNRGIRHPTQIKRIAEIAMSDDKTVQKVVEVFRAQGRSFLTPSAEIPLKRESVIDISHESLMRIWDRLKIWVDEEANAVGMYLRLSEAAEMYQLGKTGLWRPPDLQLAINWKEKQKPTLAWARRFNPAFERTMVYLETSRREFQAEEENKVRLQKRALRRTRIFAMVLGSAAIISIGVMLYAFALQIKATKEKERADAAAIEALRNEELAQQQREEAEKQTILANEAKDEAEKQKTFAQKQSEIARQNEIEAKRQADIAERNAAEARRQEGLAMTSAKLAKEQQSKAEKASDKAFSFRMLSTAKTMAVKSVQIKKDLNQKALNAYQAYKFHDKYGGKEQDNDIYNGLYDAIKLTSKDGFNNLQGHKDAVRDVVYNKDGTKLFTAGSDGRVIQWNLKGDKEESTELIRNEGYNRCLAISPNGRWLACGNNKNIQLLELSSTKSPIKFSGHSGNVWEVKFSPDSKFMYSIGSDNSIRKWSIEVQTSEIIGTATSVINAFDIDKTGSLLIAGTEAGKLMIWDLKKGGDPLELNNYDDSPIKAISFNSDGDLVAVGDLQGALVIWDVKSSPPVRTITLTTTGHDARINDIEFSNDDKLMATASWDHKVLLWVTEDFTQQPIVLKDPQQWSWSVAFSPNSDELAVSYLKGQVVKFPTHAVVMANKMCSRITRNMSLLEWQRFVAEDIDYEKTCADLPAGEGVEDNENKK